MNSDVTFSEILEEWFPYDGPHSPARVLEVADAIAELVRYLNNATGPGNGARTLEYASRVYRVLGRINSAQYGLIQLFDQLANAVQRHADDPNLYDDRHDRPTGPTVQEAIDHLGKARTGIPTVVAALDAAIETTSHLGHD